MKILSVDINSGGEDYPKEMIRERGTVSFLAEQLRLLDSHTFCQICANSVICLTVELNSALRAAVRVFKKYSVCILPSYTTVCRTKRNFKCSIGKIPTYGTKFSKEHRNQGTEHIFAIEFN